ncbi:MAG: TMEM165/GDT1 family protein [Clostridium sp.]|uniref:TMEM165/GDT1 family protein n=1 Tax=Clostridium sp. TaxID=1506 RepID=UPI002FCC0065
MTTTIFAFLFSTVAVVLAEMGDKTQLLAMAFATKYKASKVMLGVFIATIFNHGLAVLVGNYITKFESAQIWIQFIAAISFIFFGLWTIRGDSLDGEENKIYKYGAVLTVTIAFFIAEMGDKTQLATIAVATKFPESPIVILMGTTTGMLIADAIGIVIGVVMCRRIPERVIKLVSAGAFIVFGFIAVFQSLFNDMGMSLTSTIMFILALGAITGIATYYLIKNNKLDENITVQNYCKVKSKAK